MEKWKTQKRFPTFPHGARDDDYGFLSSNSKPRKEVAAARRVILFFQAFDRLGLDPHFMLILQLENASRARGALLIALFGYQR